MIFSQLLNNGYITSLLNFVLFALCGVFYISTTFISFSLIYLFGDSILHEKTSATIFFSDTCQRDQFLADWCKRAGGAVVGEVRVMVVEYYAVVSGVVVEPRSGVIDSIADGYSRDIGRRQVGLPDVALAVPTVARTVLRPEWVVDGTYCVPEQSVVFSRMNGRRWYRSNFFISFCEIRFRAGVLGGTSSFFCGESHPLCVGCSGV